MKKLIIFDLDGTLLYTAQDIADCLNDALKTFGYRELSLKKVIKLVGHGAKQLIKDTTKLSEGKRFDEILRYYVNLQENSKNEKTVLYDGLDELLVYLKQKGYLLAIVSNKPDSVTQKVCKEKFGKYGFDYIAGGNLKLYAPKPDKTCVEYCLKTLNVDKKDVLYVGDSDVDVKTYLNAEVDGVGVLWGYRTKKDLIKAGCKTFAKNTEELKTVIEKF